MSTTLRVAADIEVEQLPPGFNAQDVSDMLFSYIHGTIIPVLNIKATGQLDSSQFEDPHVHREGCDYCNNFMYDGRY